MPNCDQSTRRSRPTSRATDGAMLNRIAVGTSDQGHHRRSGPSNEPKIAIAIAPGTTLPMLNPETSEPK